MDVTPQRDDDLPHDIDHIRLAAQKRVRLFVAAQRLVFERELGRYRQNLAVFQDNSSDHILDTKEDDPERSDDEDTWIQAPVQRFLDKAKHPEFATAFVHMGLLNMFSVRTLAAATLLGDRMSGLLSLALPLEAKSLEMKVFVSALEDTLYQRATSG
ncbi:hypothetical protein BDZ89DRAFT_1152296 [Hymenopellis radicata]|nr:hypothetical protein BDZ89DRAFT_1152296 [Hymenopellis radicata]